MNARHDPSTAAAAGPAAATPACVAAFDPMLAPPDPVAALWGAEVTLRLRRELAWCWRLTDGPRVGAPSVSAPLVAGSDALAPLDVPAPANALTDSLDRLRHHDARRVFMSSDPTARYLGEQIARVSAQRRATAPTPAWRRLADDAGLDETALFVLALALAARTDAAFGPVAAACQADSQRPCATLALAQRLWPAPLAIVACADPAHALYRHALLPPPAEPGSWQQPLQLPAALALCLLDPLAPLPPALRRLHQPAPGQPATPETDDRLGLAGNPTPSAIPSTTPSTIPSAKPDAAAAAEAWLRALPPQALQIVPLHTPAGADAPAAATRFSARGGRALAALPADLPPDHPALPGLAAAAWLHGVDLLAPDTWAQNAMLAAALQPLAALPLRLWLPQPAGQAAGAGLPGRWLAPALSVPELSTAERRQRLAAALPAELAPLALDAARRYRLNDQALAAVTTQIAARRATPVTSETAAQPGAQTSARETAPLQAGLGPSVAELHAWCSTAATLDMGALAQPVAPRFRLTDLVLPPRQQQQLQAIVTAMGALARVHHDWGTARAWNEAGVAVLLCGPPGTGKTMAAEALAAELGLPMFRIDLSQVVNKYIGETEKNLRRVFDAAEAAETLLLFDEADALFGKRTEVKDAHDRYANLEVSYLLERMERFKGLAVLATNRRRDLDEAFSRRLRFIVDFPLPQAAERQTLWRAMFPPAVDVSALDFEYVARHFEMAGGPIRSAAFNACLHAAHARPDTDAPAVDMPALLLAIKRELDKAGRETQRAQFGRYAHLLPEHA